MGVVTEPFAEDASYNINFSEAPQLIMAEPATREYLVQGVVMGKDKHDGTYVSHLVLSLQQPGSFKCKAKSGRDYNILPIRSREGIYAEFGLNIPTLHETLAIYDKEDAEQGLALPPSVAAHLRRIANAQPEPLPFSNCPEAEVAASLKKASLQLRDWARGHGDLLETHGLVRHFEALAARLVRLAKITETAHAVADSSKALCAVIENPGEFGFFPDSLREGSMQEQGIPCAASPIILRSVKKATGVNTQSLVQIIIAFLPEIKACQDACQHFITKLPDEAVLPIEPIQKDLYRALGYGEILQKKQLDNVTGRSAE